MLAFGEWANVVNKCSTKARKMHHKPCSTSSIFSVIAASHILGRIQSSSSCTHSRSVVVHVLKHLLLSHSTEWTAVAKCSADVLLIKKCAVMPSLTCLHWRFASGYWECSHALAARIPAGPHTGVWHRGTPRDTAQGAGVIVPPKHTNPIRVSLCTMFYFQLLQSCGLCSLGWDLGGIFLVWDDPSHVWWCQCVRVGRFHWDFNDTSFKIREVKFSGILMTPVLKFCEVKVWDFDHTCFKVCEFELWDFNYTCFRPESWSGGGSRGAQESRHWEGGRNGLGQIFKRQYRTWGVSCRGNFGLIYRYILDT